MQVSNSGVWGAIALPPTPHTPAEYDQGILVICRAKYFLMVTLQLPLCAHHHQVTKLLDQAPRNILLRCWTGVCPPQGRSLT